jgi:uncharacterized protein (UPF0333 family)
MNDQITNKKAQERNMNPKSNNVAKKWLSGLLIFCSFIIAVLFIYISSKRTLTTLENSLLWLVGLTVSIGGSYIISRSSVEKTAQVHVKRYARSSFRRVFSLYRFISRLAHTITNDRNSDFFSADQELDKIEAIIKSEIYTAYDAIEEWRDIVPEDVEEIMKSVGRTKIEGE